MQLGVVNEKAAQEAESAGIAVIMDRCIAVEFTRLMKA
jgi:predicted CoA-binding protein